MTYPQTPGFQAHSATSQEAAMLLDDSQQLRDVERCFMVAKYQGLAAFEVKRMMRSMTKWVNIEGGTISARMATLKATGAIVPKEETRKNHDTNRQAEVFIHKNFLDKQFKLF